MSYCTVFPSRMFEPRSVEDDFAAQRAAAREAGFSTFLLDQEHLDQGNFVRAARAVEEDIGASIYRGWMLTAEQYAGLYSALSAKGAPPINSPEQYVHCHHLPESFDIIQAQSPGAVWVPLGPDGVDIDQVIAGAAEFGDGPVIIKDYVKSRKHEWEEACFVPSAADRDALRRVASTFVERQGDLLTGGVVIREFRELESIGTHPKSGMPLTREHRVFVLDGEPVAVGRYWTDGDYANDDVPLSEFAETMKAVKSRFFTMDLARQADGQWCIIELGDGQVAGLLDTIPEADLFTALAAKLSPGPAEHS